MAANVGDVFHTGEKCAASGIYRVTHDPGHTQPHDVTCVYGKSFPPCRDCKSPEFVLKIKAQHISSNEHFK